MAGAVDFILLSILHGDGAAVMADYGAVASMAVAITAADTGVVVTVADITDPTAFTALSATEVPTDQATRAEATITDPEEEVITALE